MTEQQQRNAAQWEKVLPINPHVWRKFSQAQTNFRKACGFHVATGGRTWKHSGRRMPRKMFRRQLKWGAEMARWADKLF